MQRLRRWLASVRGRDAIERRQAYLLQVFLLIVATVFYVVALLYALSSLSNATSENRFVSNATAALVLTGLVLVLRRGFFRAVAALTIAFLIYAFAGSLVTAQPHIAGSYLALLMVPLVMAGLILPRIWLLVTAVAVFAAGELAVNARPDEALIGLFSGGDLPSCCSI